MRVRVKPTRETIVITMSSTEKDELLAALALAGTLTTTRGHEHVGNILNSLGYYLSRASSLPWDDIKDRERVKL